FSPFSLARTGIHRDLHSFPTRRSSDLGAAMVWSIGRLARRSKASAIRDNSYTIWSLTADRCKTTARRRQDCKITQVVTATAAKRSEEHTSELQSRGHLVCRLLLEKKKS